MKRLLILGLPLALVCLSACSPEPSFNAFDIEEAMEQNRFHDARAGLLELQAAGDPSTETLVQLVQVHLDLGDGYSAERFLADLQQLEGQTARWTFMSAYARILQGRTRSARTIIEAFEGERPEDGSFEWALVWAAMEEGEIEEAEERVDEALRQNRFSAPLHAKGARLSIWRDNWEAANLHIAEALQYDPANYEALLLQGESQIARGDLARALDTYRTAFELYPDFAVPRANVAGLLLDLRRLEEAETELLVAIELYPDFPLLKFQLARLHTINGQAERAREVLQAIPSQWKRTFPAAYMLQAEIETALGNYAMARTLYLQLSDDPDFGREARLQLSKAREANDRH